ncbi:MAG: hypothetical protein V3V00_07700 [Saprospiraceae bacterium]
MKPYTVGAYTTGTMTEVANNVENKLLANGFEVLGSYMPVKDNNRWVIVYTSQDITDAVKKVGGLTGLAAAWRLGITDSNGKKMISYATPEYWGNAYFREDFTKVNDLYNAYSSKIKSVLAECGEGGGAEFGSKDGHDVKKLQRYKYMFGMPKFLDTKKIGEFKSFEEAVSKIDDNLAKGVENLEKVYSIELKDQKIKLYGIGLSGENGETSFMPKIDTGDPKHTAFLPYEFLVLNNEVHMLHGRYRIALSFPDLKMGQFMKIVSTPPNIKKMLEKATK